MGVPGCSHNIFVLHKIFAGDVETIGRLVAHVLHLDDLVVHDEAAALRGQ